MRILYYSPHPQLQLKAPTGYGTHMREMIGAWRQMGMDVKTLIGGDLNGNNSPSGRKGKLAAVKPFMPRLIWETFKDYKLIGFDGAMEEHLKKAIKDFRPDIIYERVAYLQNSGVKVAKSLGITHVAEINAPYPEERVSFSGRSLFLRTAKDNERQILIQSNCIVVVSSALKDHFTEIVSETENKTLVVPNCVNPLETSHTFDQVEALREQYQLRGKLVIGFVGSIFPYHGVDILLSAFAGLKNRDRYKLMIVGDGETLPDLKRQARQLGIFNDVIFTGSVVHREVYAHVEAMDICCMAKSNWYGSPVKIFEYGLMKKPVIAPATHPVKEVMTDGNEGMVVEAEPEKFRERLEILLQNKELRDKIAQNWHRKVLLEHTWDLAAKRILAACT